MNGTSIIIQLVIGTKWYDYGARFYDPSLGRFTTRDPLAELFPFFTPYHYVHNNPIRLIDPTGMSAEDPQEGDYDEETDTYYSERFGWVTGQFYSFLTHGGYSIKDNNEAMDVFLKSQGLTNEECQESSEKKSEGDSKNNYEKATDAFIAIGDVILPFVPFVGGAYEYSSGQVRGSEVSKGALILALLVDAVPGGGEAKDFFKGAKFSPKVIRQMSKSSDLHHAFPKSVDGFAANYGKLSTIVGGDNKTYQVLTLRGSYGGTTGTFTYIKDKLGNINKRQFIPD